MAGHGASGRRAGLSPATPKWSSAARRDGLYINTAGHRLGARGVAICGRRGCSRATLLLVNGTLGDHGMAVMMAREGLPFRTPLVSDCAPLNGLVEAMLAAGGAAVHCLRDATRGGLATVLHEWASATVGSTLDERSVPVSAPVAAACEFLGLDPLYVANEGKLVAGWRPRPPTQVLAAMRAHPLGAEAAVVGQVTAHHAGLVTLAHALWLGAHPAAADWRTTAAHLLR